MTGDETHRREDVKSLAVVLQSLHLAGKPCAAILPPSPVEGAHADGIPGSYKLPLGFIHDHACKDAVQRVPDLVCVAKLLRVRERKSSAQRSDNLPGSLLASDNVISHY